MKFTDISIKDKAFATYYQEIYEKITSAKKIYLKMYFC